MDADDAASAAIARTSSMRDGHVAAKNLICTCGGLNSRQHHGISQHTKADDTMDETDGPVGLTNGASSAYRSGGNIDCDNDSDCSSSDDDEEEEGDDDEEEEEEEPMDPITGLPVSLANTDISALIPGGLMRLAAVRVLLQLYRVQRGVYLLDLGQADGDCQSFMSLCARIITELKVPAAAAASANAAAATATTSSAAATTIATSASIDAAAAQAQQLQHAQQHAANTAAAGQYQAAMPPAVPGYQQQQQQQQTQHYHQQGTQHVDPRQQHQQQLAEHAHYHHHHQQQQQQQQYQQQQQAFAPQSGHQQQFSEAGQIPAGYAAGYGTGPPAPMHAVDPSIAAAGHGYHGVPEQMPVPGVMETDHQQHHRHMAALQLQQQQAQQLQHLQVMALPGSSPNDPPVLFFVNPATGAAEPLPAHLVPQALQQLQGGGQMMGGGMQ